MAVKLLPPPPVFFDDDVHYLRLLVFDLRCPGQVTGDVLHQLCAAYGVEQVHWTEQINNFAIPCVDAMISFSSGEGLKQAAKAMHCRRIWPGCCQMTVAKLHWAEPRPGASFVHSATASVIPTSANAATTRTEQSTPTRCSTECPEEDSSGETPVYTLGTGLSATSAPRASPTAVTISDIFIEPADIDIAEAVPTQQDTHKQDDPAGIHEDEAFAILLKSPTVDHRFGWLLLIWDPGADLIGTPNEFSPLSDYTAHVPMHSIRGAKYDLHNSVAFVEYDCELLQWKIAWSFNISLLQFAIQHATGQKYLALWNSGVCHTMNDAVMKFICPRIWVCLPLPECRVLYSAHHTLDFLMPKEYMLAYCEPYLFCKLLLHKDQCSCTHYWIWDPGGYVIAVRLIIYADGTPLKIARSYYCQLVFESAREVQHDCCQIFIAWYHTCRVELDVLYNYALYLAKSAVCRMLNLSMKEVGNLSSVEQLFRILAGCIGYLLKRFSFCLHCAKEGWNLNWLWDSRAAVQLASQVMCYTRTEILEAAIYMWMDWQYVSLIDSGISLGTFRGHSIRFSYLSKALAAGLSFDLSKYGGVQGALVSNGHDLIDAKLVQLPWDPGIQKYFQKMLTMQHWTAKQKKEGSYSVNSIGRVEIQCYNCACRIYMLFPSICSSQYECPFLPPYIAKVLLQNTTQKLNHYSAKNAIPIAWGQAIFQGVGNVIPVPMNYWAVSEWAVGQVGIRLRAGAVTRNYGGLTRRRHRGNDRKPKFFVPLSMPPPASLTGAQVSGYSITGACVG